ncbi:hypothetical protein M5K25_016041 [Dendrobium thyrsiflorum]|uniref:DUF4283 domain-containing protein n=1 Tax=Dendrobium thyrsiflorum TaxID=117978 RepID=A0ABD0UZA1_DENTH
MAEAVNPWGVAARPASAKPQGFFNLGSDVSKSPSRSFKEVVSGNTSAGDSISSLAHSSMNGVPAIFLFDEEVLKLASPFQFTLVAKFTLRRPNLDAIRSVFGRPLQNDQATTARSRPSVARILVEVDITKKHTKEVWLGSKAFGYMQKVEFEKVPDFCNHCKMHGHSMTDCFSLHPNLRNKSSTSNDMQEIHMEREPENISKQVMVSPIVEGREIDADSLVADNNNLAENVDKDVTNGIDNRQDITRNINEISGEPNLYISVDSMLQNTSNINLSPPTHAPPLGEVPSEHNEGGNMDDTEVEEGECVSRAKPGRIENDQNLACENDGFTKVGKKKNNFEVSWLERERNRWFLEHFWRVHHQWSVVLYHPRRVKKDVILCHHQEGEKGCGSLPSPEGRVRKDERVIKDVVLCHHQEGEKDVLVVICHHWEGEKGHTVALFNQDQGSEGEDFGEEGVPTQGPTPGSDPNFYHDMIQRFDRLDTQFDQIENHMNM